MRRLYVVRHASANWNRDGGTDFDRPLNQRGKREAVAAGRLLMGKKINPAVAFASPARRALRTAKIIAEEIGYPAERITFDDAMYLSAPDYLLQLIRGIDGRLRSAMLVGHNPGFTELVNMLGDLQIESLPTCGIYCLEFDADSWQQIGRQKGKCCFFEAPEGSQ